MPSEPLLTRCLEIQDTHGKSFTNGQNEIHPCGLNQIMTIRQKEGYYRGTGSGKEL